MFSVDTTCLLLWPKSKGAFSAYGPFGWFSKRSRWGIIQAFQNHTINFYNFSSHGSKENLPRVFTEVNFVKWCFVCFPENSYHIYCLLYHVLWPSVNSLKIQHLVSAFRLILRKSALHVHLSLISVYQKLKYAWQQSKSKAEHTIYLLL